MKTESIQIDKAIAELQQQYDQCDLHVFQNAGCKATTGSLISKYAGEESEFYLEFTKWRRTVAVFGYDEEFAAMQQRSIKLIIAHLIQDIGRNGLYIHPKPRIFAPFTDGQTFAALIGVVIAIFGAGYEFGKILERKNITKDQLKIETELDSFKVSQKKLIIPPIVTSDISQNIPQSNSTIQQSQAQPKNRIKK